MGDAWLRNLVRLYAHYCAFLGVCKLIWSFSVISGQGEIVGFGREGRRPWQQAIPPALGVAVVAGRWKELKEGGKRATQREGLRMKGLGEGKGREVNPQGMGDPDFDGVRKCSENSIRRKMCPLI